MGRAQNLEKGDAKMEETKAIRMAALVKAKEQIWKNIEVQSEIARGIIDKINGVPSIGKITTMQIENGKIHFNWADKSRIPIACPLCQGKIRYEFSTCN